MRIAILGPGGVGGFVAGALARAGHAVLVVARPGTVEALSRRALAVRSALLGDFCAAVPAAPALDAQADALIVATKASSLPAALARVNTPPPLVVPLLNGLDHLDLLRERFGAAPVAAGTIRIESTRVSPGVIVQSSPAVRVELAGDRPRLQALLRGLAAALRDAGIPTEVRGGERQILWSKLVRLNALALTTSAADRPLGEVRADPDWRAALEGAVAETAAVAAADGAAIDPTATLAELNRAHAGLVSSMQRDIAAGRATELDAIAGSVLRAARRHGIACPAVSWLTGRVAERAALPAPA
jgi:2-dehydropantoate 2-reductase